LHPADIKAAIEKAGATQAGIAKGLSVTPQAVCHVVHGRSHSLWIATRISEVTGHSIDDLWPGVYRDEAA
jgi:lambda repressor-like predicted transcriptional regulator